MKTPVATVIAAPIESCIQAGETSVLNLRTMESSKELYVELRSLFKA